MKKQYIQPQMRVSIYEIMTETICVSMPRCVNEDANSEYESLGKSRGVNQWCEE